MILYSWETALARRMVTLSLCITVAYFLFRQLVLQLPFDSLALSLSSYAVILTFFWVMKSGTKLVICTLITCMALIAILILSGVPESKTGGFFVLLVSVTFTVVYFGFKPALTVLLKSAVAILAVGFYSGTEFEPVRENMPAAFKLFRNWLIPTISFTCVGIIFIAVLSFVVKRIDNAHKRTRMLYEHSRRRHLELAEKERILTLFTELSSDYVYQIDLAKPNMMPQIMAGSFERITGYTVDDIVRKGGWFAVVHPEDKLVLERQLPRLLEGESTVTEYRIISASGKAIWLKDQVRPVRDAKTGAVTMFLGAVHDVTERRLAEEQIENLAFYDPLTSLPNRRLLLDRLEQALALSQRTGFRGALLFIDLDHFKNLNDTKGHEAGDQLLIQQARRLTLCVREGDTVARLGGDEFIIILGELAQGAEAAAEEATEITQRILHALSMPVALSYRTIADYENTSSIGIALFLGHECTVDELLGRADMAMYQAKAGGRNTFRFFDPTMQKLLTERLSLEDDLKHALAEGQFQLYLQPQILDGNVIGAEVLLRWQHPRKGMISPADFIPVAEHTGVIVEIGNWVMEESCNILNIWAGNPLTESLALAVNVSARQFRQGDFVRTVGKILGSSGVDPKKIKLELTESLALENIGDTVERMHTLRQLGVGLSLDDFGTGQSSLSYLKRLPLTQLKIDQSFVRDITSDPNDAVLVQTIIGMARNLKLDIIAEGVETAEQRDFLQKNDCHAFQGYLFGKPVHWSTFENAFLAGATRFGSLPPEPVEP